MRDGGIMICYLDDNDELHTGQENVNENCLRVLEEISGSAIGIAPLPEHFPSLPPLSDEQVERLQRICKSNKALSFDGFSDTWLKHTKNLDLIQMICRDVIFISAG